MAKNNYKVSDDGIKLLIEFEGEELKVYKDPVGLPTLGVGHLVTPAEKKDYPVGKKITRAESRSFLRRDLQRFEDAVNKSVHVPITQNQFDALVSLAFNIGEAGFKRSSVLRNLNNRKFDAAADSFLAWNKAGGKTLHGLTRRRQTERSVFLTPDPKSAAASQLTSTELNRKEPDNSDPALNQPPPDSQLNGNQAAVQVQVVTTPPDPTPPPPPPEDTLTKIGNRFNALWTAAGATIVAAVTFLTSTPIGIAVSIIAAVALIGIGYMAFNAFRAHGKEKRDAAERIDREKRELDAKLERERRDHEIQLALIHSAANKDMNSVVLVPPPVQLPNADTPAMEVQ